MLKHSLSSQLVKLKYTSMSTAKVMLIYISSCGIYPLQVREPVLCHSTFRVTQSDYLQEYSAALVPSRVIMFGSGRERPAFIARHVVKLA